MKLKQMFMPLTGLALISLASPSYAGDKGPGWDYKTYPGSACQPNLGSYAGDFQTDYTGISNTNPDASQIRKVTCPIVRDSSNQAQLDLGVTAYGGNCVFVSMDPNGGIVYTLNKGFVDLSSATTQYYSVSADNTRFDGIYVFECTLAPNGKVIKYISGEYADSTDYGN
jgi:hypothetical protein